MNGWRRWRRSGGGFGGEAGWVQAVAEEEHQFESGLVGGKMAGEEGALGNERPGGAAVAVGVEGGTFPAPGGDDDRDSLGEGTFDGGHGRDGNVAATQALQDESTDARAEREVDQAPVGTHGKGDDLDGAGKARGEDRAGRGRMGVESDDLAFDEAKAAPVPRTEGRGIFGVPFGGVASDEDFVMEDDEDAAIAGLGGGGHANGGGEIGGAVPGRVRVRAHGAGEDDGLGRGEDAIEEVGGFLEGIGSVGEDDAGYGGIGEEGVDETGEFEDAFGRHVRPGDAVEVGHGEVRDPGERGNLLEEFGAGERGDGAASGSVMAHGDGPSGEDEGDAGKRWIQGGRPER